MSFGRRLKELREEQGLNQDDLYPVIGYKKPAISQWETGKHTPALVVIEALADHFKVSVDYLLGRTDIRRPDVSALTPRAKNHAEAYLKVAETAAKYNLKPEDVQRLIEQTGAIYGPLYQTEEDADEEEVFAAHGPRLAGQLDPKGDKDERNNH